MECATTPRNPHAEHPDFALRRDRVFDLLDLDLQVLDQLVLDPVDRAP
jgi:hypothetical protein